MNKIIIHHVKNSRLFISLDEQSLYQDYFTQQASFMTDSRHPTQAKFLLRLHICDHHLVVNSLDLSFYRYDLCDPPPPPPFLL